MIFHRIDLENWERKEHFLHYLNQVVCSYSLTVHLDVSPLRKAKLYPTLLWLLTSTVNDIKEFRISQTPDGIGYYQDMHPSYTIFNRNSKTFSDIWTEFHPDYPLFLQHYQEDVDRYASSTAFSPKENRPVNTFDVSMLLWTTFTSFNLNIEGGGRHLLPIFTMGKTFTDGEKTMMPLAIQVHHAVCDGYHVGMFVQNLQDRIDRFPESPVPEVTVDLD